MIRENSTRTAWHPNNQQERDAILQELQTVLASTQFCNSKRYPALLQYIVENTLEGRSDLLKERTLGVEVFDRPPTYDTNADTVVRYTAGEVRRRLALYYHESGRNHGIRISLPVGSYVPEFWHGPFAPEEHTEAHNGHATIFVVTEGADTPGELQETLAASPSLSNPATDIVSKIEPSAIAIRKRQIAFTSALLALVVIFGSIGFYCFKWKQPNVQAQSAMEEFWMPVLHDQHETLICTGGSVFAQNRYSGVETASKDTDYPFISIQGASAIAQISGLLEHEGSSTLLKFSNSTPLTELRERPIILLGAYNNQWTLRLLEPLRFHFSPLPDFSIMDQSSSHLKWERDHSLPYSSSDDYALVARFRDTTTDGWVVVLAGIGRNGSEAAAEFVTSPHYMQLLKDKLNGSLANKNIEVVLKVNVIDAKTGAPSILNAYSW
jgi:hypothetical protein